MPTIVGYVALRPTVRVGNVSERQGPRRLQRRRAPATPSAPTAPSGPTSRPAPTVSPNSGGVSQAASTQVAATSAPSPTRTAAITLDWVPRAQLTAARLRVLPEYCDGAYVEPPFVPLTDAQIDALPMQVQAEQLQYWLKDRAELTGGVQVTRGNQSLIASNATYHEPQRMVSVADGVMLREPGMLIVGETGEFYVDTGAASVTDSTFVLQPNELRGTATVLNRNDTGDLHVTRGSFTRCEPGNKEWRVTSSAVQIDDGAKFGTARNAVLRVYDVPIFYTPYLRFPVTDERMSGWLFPDIGFGQNNGTDIAVPYYLNLAPNYDATLIPRYISDRGTDLEGEFRQISRYGKMDFGGAYMPKDNEYNGKYSRTDFDSPRSTGSVRSDGSLALHGPPASAFRRVSRRASTARKSATTTIFAISAVASRRPAKYSCSNTARCPTPTAACRPRVWVQDFQRLDVAVTEPYRRLPEIDLNYATHLVGPVNAVHRIVVGELRSPERRVHRHCTHQRRSAGCRPRCACRSIGAPGSCTS